jgi:hypothetical protein
MADCYNSAMKSQTQVALQPLPITRGVGRPRAIDEGDVRKLSKLFKAGHTVATACRLSGIPRSTYYDELARNEEFSDRMQAAQELTTAYATEVVTRSIRRFNVQTAKWWLDRQDRREYHAQRATEYRNIKKVTVSEIHQQSHSVSMEVDQ